MARKHYVLIAEAIQETKNECVKAEESTIPLSVLQDRIAQILANDNPKFNYDRFREACLPTV